ncbi:protein ecdysoneless homolog [Penaeus indicus]|uniref:protein ecdysoneless homolog n=1 Tax=Penaeus indicus TaxID=29960 RepID=UPI00300D9D1C
MMACGSVFNQMPTDNEETIRYWLFPHLEDGTLMTDLEALEDLAAKLLAHVAVYTHQYIWNKESFTLKVKKDAPCDGTTGVLGPHIAGITVVGDYLEDEWFIVYLLLTLTKDFPELVFCKMTKKYQLKNSIDVSVPRTHIE